MPIEVINRELEILHDSRLISINDNLDSNFVVLTFLSEDKKSKISVHIEGLLNSRCDNWKFGNIVLDAEVVDRHSNRILDILFFIEDYNEIQIDNKKYESILDKINKELLYIFEINPTYGAYYAAIAKNIKIIKSHLDLDSK